MEKVANLEGQIEGATGAAMHGLARQLAEAAKQLIRDQEDLALCERTQPPPPEPPPPEPPPPPDTNPPPSPSDACIDERRKVGAAQEKVADLEGQIEGASGAVLHGLAGQLSRALNQLARDEESLAACEGKLPPFVPAKPITIGVDRIVCAHVTSGAGSDTPYLLVLAVDMTSTVNVNVGGTQVPVTFPSLRVTRIGPWEDVDDDSAHFTADLGQSDRRPFWSLTGDLQLRIRCNRFSWWLSWRMTTPNPRAYGRRFRAS